MDESCDVGQDTGTPVIDECDAKMPLQFTGTVRKAEFENGSSDYSIATLRSDLKSINILPVPKTTLVKGIVLSCHRSTLRRNTAQPSDGVKTRISSSGSSLSDGYVPPSTRTAALDGLYKVARNIIESAT
jgi:hypothetical protein